MRVKSFRKRNKTALIPSFILLLTISLTRFPCQTCLTGKSDEDDYLYVQNTEVHEEPSQTSKMELFANIVMA